MAPRSQAEILGDDFVINATLKRQRDAAHAELRELKGVS
jgi:hypothetical protein